jgi:hypothetical protein
MTRRVTDGFQNNQTVLGSGKEWTLPACIQVGQLPSHATYTANLSSVSSGNKSRTQMDRCSDGWNILGRLVSHMPRRGGGITCSLFPCPCFSLLTISHTASVTGWYYSSKYYSPMSIYCYVFKGVAIDVIWIGEWIYWPLIYTTLNYK